MSNINAVPTAAIAVPAEVVAKLSNLSEVNSVAQASIDFYVNALGLAGIDDVDSLTFAETVEVTRRLYADSADFRRTRADVAKAEREAERAKAKEIADAKKRERLQAERAALAAKLAKLEAE